MAALVAPGCRSEWLISTYSLSPGSLLLPPAVSLPLDGPAIDYFSWDLQGICEAFFSFPSHILSGSLLILFLEDIFSCP